jgi:hypothetical protein
MHARISANKPSHPAAGLLRRLLVLVLAFDLVSSPFHHHAHDAGDTLFAMQEDAGAAEPALHIEADDHKHGGHSLSLLLPRMPEPPQPDLYALPLFAALSPAAWQAPVLGHERPLGAPEPVPVASDRHRRPSSRAPPFLHA